MKADIHPKYEKTVIKCACGSEFETKSTVFPEIHVELCSACHPFYTGKQKFVDTAGRVDKFRARLEKAAAKKAEKTKKPSVKGPEMTNKEKLAEIKSNFAKASLDKEKPTDKPAVVDQAATSGEELAAADELADKSGAHKPENQ